MDIQELGPGRFLVQSGSGNGWYSVTDGICECKGYEFKQKCKHVARLIDLGKLNPVHVEGYFRGQQHTPIKVASPDYDPGRYLIWVAAYENEYLRDHADEFFKIGLVPKPWGMTLPYRVVANFDPLRPDDVLLDLDPEDFVQGYRAQLNDYGIDRIMTFMRNCQLQAKGKMLVFLSPGNAVGLPHSFANPRRIFATWYYELTHEVIPEMR